MGERIASWFAIALMTAVLFTSYWYAQSLRSEGAQGSGRVGAVDFFAEGVALTGFDALGRPRYRLFADRMTHYGSSDDVDLLQPRLLSMRPDQPRVQARAETAHAANNGETIEMRGKVEVTRESDGNRPPMHLHTEVLSAMPDQDRLWTDAAVQVDDGQSRLQARGMDYDNVTRHLDLRADVVGSFPSRSRK